MEGKIIKGLPKPRITGIEYFNPKNKKTGKIDYTVTVCKLYHDIDHLKNLLMSSEAYELFENIPNPIQATAVMKDGDKLDEKKSKDIARAKAKRKLYERISTAFVHDLDLIGKWQDTNKKVLEMLVEKYTHENDYFNALTLNEEYTDVE